MTAGGQEVALEGGESLESAERVCLQAALATVLGHRSPVRRAAVYLVARDRAIVRLFLGQGWIPVMVERSALLDLPSLAGRLALAL